MGSMGRLSSIPIIFSFILMLPCSLLSEFKARHELHRAETTKLNRKCLRRSVAQIRLTVKLGCAPKNVLWCFLFALK